MQNAEDHGSSKVSAGLSLSKGLPPIPYRQVEKISREEFVDIQELLPESW